MPFKHNQEVALCPTLLGNQPCHDHACRKSHNREAIRAAQQRARMTLCWRGGNCQHLFTDACGYSHSDEDRAQVKRKRIKQVTELTHGLTDLETVDTVVECRRLGGNLNFIGIANGRELASFNKTGDGEIAVPGHPPRFTPLTQALKVQSDTDKETSDFKSPRYRHHFEPLLESVKIMEPSFDMLDSVDVISNAGNLRKLFDLLCNNIWMANRFDLEMRGATLLLSRWNEDPQLQRSLGCGPGFERKTCQYAPDDDPILKKSASHHRVVSYRFGGLQCVVQSEVDGYCCECDHSDEFDLPAPPPTSATTSADKKRQSDPLPSPPIRKLPGLTRPRHRHSRSTDYTVLDRDDPGDSPAFTPPRPPTTTSTLRIHHTRRFIPASCLVEIKTHNSHSPGFSTHHAQMYFSRRPLLYSAAHKNRVFKPGPNLVVKDVREELRGWEWEQQGRLQQLAALLRLVRERIAVWHKEKGVERFSLVCECDGVKGDGGVRVKLCEREAGEGGLLPPS